MGKKNHKIHIYIAYKKTYRENVYIFSSGI